MLNAYELGADNWKRYTSFDPSERAMGMTYPESWIRPNLFLQNPQYQDSSITFMSWDQIFTSGESDFSNIITAQYIPYTSSQRWSVGMELISYKGSNPADHSDVAFDFRYKKGSVNAFHTTHTQRLNIISGPLLHEINSNSIIFDHRFGKKLLLSGGLDYQEIEQQEVESDSLARYDASHQFLKVGYPISKTLLVYSMFEHRNFQNYTRNNDLLVFRPGLRFKRGIFMTHLAARISPLKFFPIAQLSLKPDPFLFEVYLKVRNPLFILKQPAYQYVGVKAGVEIKGELHSIKANAELTYDTPISSSISNFYMLNTFAEYQVNLNIIDLYLQAEYSEDFDYVQYYYHPEKANIKSGLSFHKKLQNGKLLIDGDINAQYILHDDPDSVSFNPMALIYIVTPNAALMGDWMLNFKIKATVSDFSISAFISTPLSFENDINWYLYEGIYSSSEFYVGNTLYVGINISWLWRK
jgi:hypothetical protein